MDPVHGRRGPRQDLRPMEEGGDADLRLGGSGLMRGLRPPDPLFQGAPTEQVPVDERLWVRPTFLCRAVAWNRGPEAKPLGAFPVGGISLSVGPAGLWPAPRDGLALADGALRPVI